MADAAADLPVFPLPRSCPFDPPPEYRTLHEQAPLTRVAIPGGRSAWLVTGHAQVRKLLADPRVSANRAHPDFPSLFPMQEGVSQQAKGFLPWMDPPEHTVYRRMVVNEFTVRRVRQLKPMIEKIVDDCVTGLLAHDHQADLVRELALPVPSLTICELLGVPYADRDVFQKNTTISISRDSSPEERMAALVDLRGYLAELIGRKQREPEDDLLSRLAEKYHEAGITDDGHLVGMALLILAAGHDTTASMIALGTATLLENPEQLAALRADPSLLPSTVEELLRYLSIADQSTRRFATEDIDVDGITVRAGDGLLLSNAAANRDATAFAAPDTFDIGRETRQHVAFGYGIHQCVGQNLARLELEVVFGTLFDRIPTLRLAVPVGELAFKTDTITYGVHSLPVAW